jgi:phospholipase/carboxylesterase
VSAPARGPHQGQPNQMRGDHESPQAAMILLHGRGDSAQGILRLVDQIARPGWAFIAPQAAGNTWYPNRFIAPISSNEPWLSSALQAVQDTLEAAQTAGVPLSRTILLGFSQGACLALEYAARNGAQYGGVVGLSGGLIGDVLEPSRYPKSLSGTPVFVGCSDVDAHIPKTRVEESAVMLGNIGARVDARIYPNLGHTINDDELDAVRGLMRNIA